MFDDPWHESLVLLLRILLVQNAVFFPPESDTAETVLACIAGNAVEQIGTLISTRITEAQAGNVVTTSTGFIDKLRRTAEEREIPTIVRLIIEVETMFEVLTVLNETATLNIARFDDAITGTLFGLMHDGMRPGMLQHHFLKFFSILFALPE